MSYSPFYPQNYPTADLEAILRDSAVFRTQRNFDFDRDIDQLDRAEEARDLEFFSSFPIFKNAPPPSILYGDNEGRPVVIAPMPPPPNPVFRAPPSIIARPPVRIWPDC